MITVTPEDPYITLTTRSVPKGAKVYLSGCKCGRTLKVEYTEDSNEATVGPVPSDLCNGVYTLFVCHNPKTCAATYNVKVNVQMKTTPTPIVEHDPTDPNAGETIMECCEDASGTSTASSTEEQS